MRQLGQRKKAAWSHAAMRCRFVAASLLFAGRHDDRVEILLQYLLQTVFRERALDDDAGIAGVEYDELRAGGAHGFLDRFARLPLVNHHLDGVVTQVLGQRSEVGIGPAYVLLDEVAVDVETHVVREIYEVARQREHDVGAAVDEPALILAAQLEQRALERLEVRADRGSVIREQ